MSAGQVRATISQIEKYNQAVNTFRGKYNYLPGDMQQSAAAQFGFTYPVGGRSGGTGRGDGNGIVQGYCNGCSQYSGSGFYGGEQAFFWEDLSANTNLISDVFNTATDSNAGYASTDPSVYMPRAKLSGNNIFITISTSNVVGTNLAQGGAGSNAAGFYWVIEGISPILNSGYFTPGSISTNVLVKQAQMMDAKIDDGLPTAGNVQAVYIPSSPSYGIPAAAPNASPATSSSCYDSGTGQYATSLNGGKNATCALMIQGQF